MCHTNFMKKSHFIFIPLVFMLASCDTFNVGFTNDKHEPGIENGTVSKYVVPSYPTYSGDKFTVTDEDPRAVITFTGCNDGLSNIQDIEKLNSFVSVDQEDFFATVESPLNVGTDEEDGLFIGADSSYVDGEMTLAFKKDIKYIEIVATPYFFVSHSWNEETYKIDQDVCISVNDSPYISLLTTQNEDGSLKETTCHYSNNAQDNKDKITIKVGRRRAFIKKITLYY